MMRHKSWSKKAGGGGGRRAGGGGGGGGGIRGYEAMMLPLITSLQLGLDLIQALVCPGAAGSGGRGSAGGSVDDLAVGELGHGHGGDVRDDVGGLLSGRAGHGSHRGHVGGVAEGRGAEEAGQDGAGVGRVQRHGRGQCLRGGEKRRVPMYM